MSRRSDNWAVAGAAAAIALAGAAAYAGIWSGVLVFDDMDSITENPSIRSLRHLAAVLHPPADGATVSGRPVLNLSFALNWAISGPALGSYHAFNLAIHVCAALALFGIVRRTLLLPALGCERKAALWLGLAVAALWELHPLQTESVTYVVQRAESLMGLFYLLTLYAYIRYAAGGIAEPGRAAASPANASPPPHGGGDGRPRLRWAFLSVIACLLGMGTKEVMVSVPVIALLYDRTFISGSFREAVRRHWGCLGALALTWVPLAGLVIANGNRGGTSGAGVGVSAWQYWLTQPAAIWDYVRLSFWPHPLILDYGFESRWIAHPASAIPAAIFLAALAAGTGVALVRRPSIGFLGVWFFAILAPTSVVPGNRQTLAEHRMYLALAPVIALVVVGLARMAERRWMKALLAAAAAIAAVFGALVLRRNVDYKSALGMWTLVTRQRPRNAYAWINQGAILYLDGRKAEAAVAFRHALEADPREAGAYCNLGMVLEDEGDTGAAMADYRTALSLKADNWEAENNLGVALASLGKWDDAIGWYRKAIAHRPTYGDAEANLANAYQNTGRLADAIRHYEIALQIEPESAETHFNLGLAYGHEGLYERAIGEYREALRLKPTLGAAEAAWGAALATEGDRRAAIPHLRAALKLHPPNPAEVWLNLGIAEEAGADNAAAAQAYRSALRLSPGYFAAANDLGTALLKLGQPAESAHWCAVAVRLDPKNAQAHYNLGLALAAEHRTADAVAEYRRALELQPGMPGAENSLAVALAGTGKLEDALVVLEDLVRRSPDFAQGHLNLGLLLRALGRTQEADAEFAKARRLGAAPH